MSAADTASILKSLSPNSIAWMEILRTPSARYDAISGGIVLTANDIFFTNFYEFTLEQGSVSATGLRRNDTRRFGMTLRYNFGIRNKEEQVNMFNLDSQPQN